MKKLRKGRGQVTAEYVLLTAALLLLLSGVYGALKTGLKLRWDRVSASARLPYP